MNKPWRPVHTEAGLYIVIALVMFWLEFADGETVQKIVPIVWLLLFKFVVGSIGQAANALKAFRDLNFSKTNPDLQNKLDQQNKEKAIKQNEETVKLGS